MAVTARSSHADGLGRAGTRQFDATCNQLKTNLGMKCVGADTYGTDALILVRPDGHIGLVAGPAETGTVSEYLRSL